MEKEAKENEVDDKRSIAGLLSSSLDDSEEPMYEYLLTDINLSFEIFPLFTKPEDSRDFANTIAIDHQYKWRVAVGSEKGKIIVFNLKSKKTEAVLKGDIWITSLEIKRSTIFAVGAEKTLEAFNYRSQNRMFKVPSFTKEYEGFGSKGIMIKNIRNSNLLICNMGYSRLLILDRQTRKILRKIDFGPEKLGKEGQETKKVAILNHQLVQEVNILVLLFRGDSNLYFFDLKRLTLLKRVKLFNFEELPSDMFLMNTEIVSHGGKYIAVILQFSYNKRKRNCNKTIFYYFDINSNYKPELPPQINFSFYHAIPFGNEVFISCDMIQMKPDHEVATMRHLGYLLLIGTSQGEFIAHEIFTETKTCATTRWLRWKTNTEVTGAVRNCDPSCYYLTADGNLTHVAWQNY